MAIIKVLAGDLRKGQQRIDPKWVKSAELQTEESLKKLAGSAGWGFTGAIVGGLLTGGLGLVVGGLAGVLSGGNKTEVCFSCELEDGRKFLAITDKKTYQSILAVLFQKEQEKPSNESVFEEQIKKEERETERNLDKIEDYQATPFMFESEVDEVRNYLELALAKYDIKLQVSQAKNQLNIVVNRGAESLLEYLELTKSVKNELKDLKSKGLNFNSVDKVKLIGRVAGSTQPEWQEILDFVNEVSPNSRKSLNGDSTFNNFKHGSPENSKITDNGKVSSELQTKILSILSRFWKWYISGFASRPDKALYESPRLYRILFTYFILGWILRIFPYQSVPSSSFSKSVPSSSSSSPVTSITKAGPTLCVNNFNQKMGPSASATFDSSSQTMNVYVSNGVTTQQDAEKIADAMADATFSTCDMIEVLKVEINGFNGYLTRTSP